MTWRCDGIPQDGKSYSSLPHPSDPCDNPDFLTECAHCGLPRTALSPTTPPPPPPPPRRRLPLQILGGIAIAVIAGITISRLTNNNTPIVCLPTEIQQGSQCIDPFAKLNTSLDTFQSDLDQHLAEATPGSLKQLIQSARSLRRELKAATPRLLDNLNPEEKQILDEFTEFVDFVARTDSRTDPDEFSQELLSQFILTDPTQDIKALTLKEKQQAIADFLAKLKRDIFPNSNPVACKADPTLLSSGERPLFTVTEDRDRQLGSEHFAKADYQAARESFRRSASIKSPYPESVIYLNNAIARQADPEPYRIAVVIPIEQGQSRAEEILRGVADSQRAFNQNEENQGRSRLLEVLIANDRNDVGLAQCISQTLAANPDILAVIGHGSSKTTQAGLPAYLQAKLPILTPTSTSTALSGETFFRTVPSDAETGKTLARYINNDLKETRVAIFYIPTDPYSNSLYQAFVQNFRGDIQTISTLGDPNFDDPSDAVKQIINNNIKIAVLMPNTDNVSRAVQIVSANARLSSGQNRLTLVGGDALYTSDFLLRGRSAAEGVVLAVPWYSSNQNYPAQSEQFWGGQFSWRTASSYDATQAITQSLISSINRETLLNRLRSINLTEQFTSGLPLRFDANQERQSQPLLVKVCPNVPRPQGAESGFAPFEMCDRANSRLVPPSASPAPPPARPAPSAPTPVSQRPQPAPPPAPRPQPAPPVAPPSYPSDPAPPPGPPLWGPGSEPAPAPPALPQNEPIW